VKAISAFQQRQPLQFVTSVEKPLLSDPQVVFSINFASTLWMPALTGNFDPCLDRFTMGAAIFTILGCQTTATRMFTAVLALIVYKFHK